MSIIEGTYSHDGVTVKYKYRKAVGDRRNLLVIFSGFRNRGTYDFDGAPTAGVRGNILWILDDFADNFSYYLCSGLDFGVERATASLIDEAIRYLDISPEQCAVAGFSKGGSAALYYGIKYNYGAIIATVPQFHIGSYVKKNWPEVFVAMTADGSSEECEYLDSLLPTLIRQDGNLDRNVYLFSSESDPQHKTEIEPYLIELGKYSNFNYVLTSSPLVDTHSAVTRYNVPALTSIMSLLSEGTKPVLGPVRNGSLAPGNDADALTLEQVRSRGEVVHGFTSLSFKGSVLFPEGYAFVKGHPADDYGKVRARIQFASQDLMHEVPLGGVKDPLLSTRFYENQFCDYSVGKFASIAHKGIPLVGLADGRYVVSLDIRHGGTQRLVPARGNHTLVAWSTGEGSLYKVEMDEFSAILTKRPALGPTAKGRYFSEVGRWAVGARIHFEGHFAVQGIPTANYHDVKYYLVLCDAGGHPAGIFPMASDHRPDADRDFGDPWVDYSKAYYATPKYKGIEVTGTDPGRYRALITARFGDAVFSEPLEGAVAVSATFSALATDDKPVVDIIGSCVSRDNFNSRLAPGWKSYFSLGNEHYQSAFLSLMSKPVAAPPQKLEGNEAHSTRVIARDFAKTYLEELVAGQVPDVLVIDFFADARFGCLRVDSSLVTDNSWKLHETDYWKEISEPRTLNPWDHETEYLEKFRIAAIEFNELRAKHFPETQIILNSARAVFSYFDKGARVRFSEKFVSDLNTRWAKLDEVFLQCVPARVVSAATITTLSDPDHPWGPAPYHYEAEYYSLFKKKLLSVLGYEMTVSVE